MELYSERVRLPIALERYWPAAEDGETPGMVPVDTSIDREEFRLFMKLPFLRLGCSSKLASTVRAWERLADAKEFIPGLRSNA